MDDSESKGDVVKKLPSGFAFDQYGSLTYEDGDNFYVVTGSKFEIINLIKNRAGTAGSGYRLRITDYDGGEHIVDILAKDLLKNRLDILSDFIDKGFEIISYKYFLIFIREIRRLLEVTTIISTNRQGWDANTLAFNFVDKTFKKEDDPDEYVFQGEQGKVVPITAMQGTLKEYQEHVIPIIKQDAVFVVSLCAALSNIIHGLSDIENGGLLFFGDSSTGKTTALQVFASVYGFAGDPGQSADNGFISRFNATKNGMEARCVLHNSIGMAIDELGSYTGRDFGSVIYDFSGGQAKTVMNSARKLVESSRWEFIFVASGEESIKEKVLSSGQPLKTGMSVRIADIPIELMDRYYGQPPSSEATRQLVENTKKVCSEYYGSLGPSFIELIISSYADKEEAKADIKDRLDIEKELLAIEGMSGEVGRVIARFALLQTAGKMAIEGGLIDISEEEVEFSIKTAINAWVEGSKSISNADRGLDNIRDFLFKNIHKFFSLDKSRIVTNSPQSYPPGLLGYKKNGNFLLLEDTLKKAAGDVDLRIVKKALRDRGLLYLHKADSKDKRYKVRQVIPGVGKLPFYAIKESFVNDHVDPEIEGSVGSELINSMRS